LNLPAGTWQTAGATYACHAALGHDDGRGGLAAQFLQVFHGALDCLFAAPEA